MDPVTTAILASIAAGVAAGAQAITSTAVKDGYEALKSAIRERLGAESETAKAIESLERNPKSQGRKETLKEEIVASKVDQDPEILKSAQALLNEIKSQPDGAHHIQSAVGNYIAQADRGSSATVNINAPE